MPSREIPGNTLAGGDGIRLLIYCDEGSAAAGLENAWKMLGGVFLAPASSSSFALLNFKRLDPFPQILFPFLCSIQ